MSYLDGKLVVSEQLRAQLALRLIESGEYEQALQAALPLVGTAFQCCFLFARAWQLRETGDVETARQVLAESLAQLQPKLDLETGPFLFFKADGTIAHLEEFYRLTLPERVFSEARLDDSELSRIAASVLSTEDSLKRPFTAMTLKKIYRQLRPLVPVCVSPYEVARAAFQPEALPGNLYWEFLCQRFESRQTIESTAQELLVLHSIHGPSFSLSGLVGFFLAIAERYEECLAISDALLDEHPKNCVAGNLRALALHRTGRPWLAQEQWRVTLKACPYESLNYVFLGLIALENGTQDVSIRFLHEAVICEGHEGFGLASGCLGMLYDLM